MIEALLLTDLHLEIVTPKPNVAADQPLTWFTDFEGNIGQFMDCVFRLILCFFDIRNDR